MDIKKNIKGLLFFAVVITSCTNTSVPAELENNEEAIQYIKDLDRTVNKFNALVVDLAKISGGKDIDSTDNLSTGQKLKLAKTAGQFMLVSKKIEGLIETKTDVEATLNQDQLAVFSKICDELENNMGNIDISALDMNEEQLAEFKQKFEENKKYNQQKRAYRDSVLAVRQDSVSSFENTQQHGKVDHNPSKKKKTLFFVAFGIVSLALIVGVIFIIILLIKKIKNIR